MLLVARITGLEPQLGGSIVGYGVYHDRYASGREGQAFGASFAAYKAALTSYLLDGIGRHADLLALLGPHRTGVGCRRVLMGVRTSRTGAALRPITGVHLQQPGIIAAGLRIVGWAAHHLRPVRGEPFDVQGVGERVVQLGVGQAAGMVRRGQCHERG